MKQIPIENISSSDKSDPWSEHVKQTKTFSHTINDVGLSGRKKVSENYSRFSNKVSIFAEQEKISWCWKFIGAKTG